MTAPVTRIPAPSLGNSATGIASGLANFVAGLKAENDRRRMEALQTALGQANISHLGAETSGLEATTAEHTHANEPIGEDQIQRLQLLEPKYTPQHLQGMSRGEADDLEQSIRTQKALENRMFFTAENRVLPSTDAAGNVGIIRPGLPGQTPEYTPVTGAAKPVNPQQAHRGALGVAAQKSNSDLTRIENSPNSREVMSEVARSLSGPALLKIFPFINDRVEDAVAQMRLIGLSPAAAFYIKRLYDHASLVAPERYGRQFRNPAILHQAWMDFGAGQITTSPETFAANVQATQLNRNNGVQQLFGSAGPNAINQAEQAFSDTTVARPNRYLPEH